MLAAFKKLNFVAQLVLNGVWSPMFFGAQAIAVALAVIVLLWGLIALTLRRFWVIDRVAAYYRHLRLGRLRLAAFQHLCRYLRREAARECRDVERCDRAAAFCIYIREGVGDGDLAVLERVIHDWREEIHG